MGTDFTTTDLVPAVVCPGGSASFTTTPSGTGPFTYAWTKDGSPLAETGPSLSIPSAQASDAGTYCVTVTDTGGKLAGLASYGGGQSFATVA